MRSALRPTYRGPFQFSDFFRISFLLSGIILISSVALAAEPFDILIRNGHIIDGTGSPWYAADLGIRDGRIVAIGHLSGTATRRVDAHGMVVAPGFIDMLGQ